ncbi:tellurite resistance protein [Rhizobium sp. BK529]|nr:tellurite resistance protein [Rhizobium sp. BK529]
MMELSKLPLIPASFFGMVLGLAGLANTWRLAHNLWGLPELIGELLTFAAAATWLLVSILYMAKWVLRPAMAKAEAAHPVQCCFIGLGGVATMLVAQGMLPYSRAFATGLFALGATYTLAFAIWRTGLLLRGERDIGATTPVLYLPAVAGGFVTGTTAALFGAPDWGQLAFGAALFSWLAIESVLLHRLYSGPMMPASVRATLGIQLAPPAVGAVAYLSVGGGLPDIFAHALLGYAMLQAILLVRMLPWIMEEGFSPSFWAFTFGSTALAAASMLLAVKGDHGATIVIAPVLFISANLVVLIIAMATIRLAMKGQLLTAGPPATRA